MCARFSLNVSREDLQALLDLSLPPGWSPAVNIAPSDPILGLDSLRSVGLYGFGAIPAWSRDQKRLVNARWETAGSKPSFRKAFAERRRLVPATSFFEWNAAKQPYAIRVPHQPLLWLAAIEEPLGSLLILTRDAVPEMIAIHGRMPCLVPPDQRESWFESGDTWIQDAFQTEVETWAVSRDVNKPAAQGSHLLDPIELFGTL